MKKKFNRVFWGLFFVLGAALVIMSQLGFFEGLNVISIIFSVFLVAIVIKSLQHCFIAGIIFPLAIMLILFKESIGIGDFSTWAILAVALLLTIGLSVIFNRKNYFINIGPFVSEGTFGAEFIDKNDENEFNFEVTFGSSVKYINSPAFKRANVECNFGNLKLFFDNATLDQKGAVLNIEVNFGGVEIFIPKEWRVQNNIQSTLGGVEEKNQSNPSEDKTLIIYGEANFSGVTIIYV